MKSNFPTATTIPALICNQLNFLAVLYFQGANTFKICKRSGGRFRSLKADCTDYTTTKEGNSNEKGLIEIK